MRVLVTGATGFIGRARVNHLTSLGNSVIAIGNQHTDKIAPIQANFDISERDSIKYLLSRYKPDRVEHFASQSTVSVSRDDPWITYRTNILGAVSVLEAAKKTNPPTPVLMFTTDKFYGDVPVADELTIPVVTGGAYENSKLCQDYIAQSYIHQGAKVTIARSCNVFGPNDYNRRIIPNTIRALEESRKPIIFKNVRGIRQYIYISDLMSALDTIVNRQVQDHNIFNIGTDMKLSQADVVQKIINVWNNLNHTSVEADIQEAKEPAQLNEIPEQYLVWDRLKTYGWKPASSDFSECIKYMLDIKLQDTLLDRFLNSHNTNTSFSVNGSSTFIVPNPSDVYVTTTGNYIPADNTRAVPLNQ
jgi:dTDP-glucose 4,6-dehydratase